MIVTVEGNLGFKITRHDSNIEPGKKPELLISAETGKIRISCDNVQTMCMLEEMFIKLSKAILDKSYE